ncbi:MAG: acetoacetyl-CoA reductase, partial [Granulosicoccaceae bacterium]
MPDTLALVTGGTGGLGTAMCRALSDAGHRVVANYFTGLSEQALEWQKQQKQDGYDFALVEGDVSDFDDCARMIAEVETSHGPIDVLINNAGITRDATLKRLDKAKWDAVISTNLNSVFYMSKQVIEGMMDRGFGRIINISSVNGQRGQFGQGNYSAAKAGVHGFTMAAAQEGARKGVTVNSISPGYVGTEMVMAMKPEVIEHITSEVPVGRLGEPWEIARVAVFLAARESGYITGADMYVNGGL